MPTNYYPILEAGSFYHIYNQGNDGINIFYHWCPGKLITIIIKTNDYNGFRDISPRWGLFVVGVFLLQRFHLYEVYIFV